MHASILVRALAALSVTFATTSFAAAALGSAHVLAVRVDGDGRGIVFFDQPLAGSPVACGQVSSYKNALAFSATTGKGALAMALSAKATGSLVDVYGTGVCNVYGNWVEDLDYGVVH